MKRLNGSLLLAALLLACAASARMPDDGTLGLIQTPNNGIPSIVTPGGQFDVVLKEKAELKLMGEQPAPALQIVWSDLPGGRVRARCTVPADMPPGTYALEAVSATNSDRNERAVYVLSQFPEYYVVAHLTDTHIGSDRHPRPSVDILRDAIVAVNATDAAFVFISGDLTESGTADQFRQFMAVMDECVKPTLVCPGNHDRGGRTYEQFFGPLTYGFLFGPDGYIAFDTKDYVTADDLGSQNADLEVLRRATKSCRWSIGVTHRYEPSQSMRSQLILFADNPLDHLMFGHEHRAKDNEPRIVPWQTTPMTMTPATIDGFMRLYDISPKAVHPREPQRVAAIAPPEPAPEAAPAEAAPEQPAHSPDNKTTKKK